MAQGKTHKLFIVIIITLDMEYREMGEQLHNTLSLDAAGLLQALRFCTPSVHLWQCQAKKAELGCTGTERRE